MPIVEIESLSEILLRNLCVGSIHDTGGWAIVLEATTNCVGELPAGVGVTVEDVDEGVSRFLTGEVRPDDGADVAVVDPLLHDNGTNRVYDYNGVAASLGSSKDEVVAPFLGIEVVSVADVVVPGDVSFSRVGIDEHEADILLGGIDFDFSEEGVVQNGRDLGSVLGGLLLDSFKWGDEVFEIRTSRTPADGKSN